MKKINVIFSLTTVLAIIFLPACGQSKANHQNKIIVNNPNEFYSTDDSSTTESKKYTVTFKDEDGKVLKKESVVEGMSATPPINATKEGYKVSKWDKPIDSITKDIVVTPVYEKISGPTVSVGNITAKAGDTVKVPVEIQNNPGINGVTLKIEFDSNLVLKKAKSGAALKELKYTEPGKYENPSTFLWDGMEENIKENGEVLILTFKISDEVKPGDKLGISLSCNEGDIYDKDLNNVHFDTVGGSITIK